MVKCEEMGKKLYFKTRKNSFTTEYVLTAVS